MHRRGTPFTPVWFGLDHQGALWSPAKQILTRPVSSTQFLWEVEPTVQKDLSLY